MSSGDEVKPPSTTQDATASIAPSAESKPATAPVKSEGDDKSATTQPLAPPPKPSQQNGQSQPQQTPDYFGGNHNNFSLEPNPFEQSFGQPSSAETPGKGGGLPPVASLTSPAPLGPGGTPNWSNSLRSGPLSPAMLQGPVNSNGGYFDQEFRNNYPTPNESSLRTGLTPGGGGSMFPAPSPNTAAIFNLSGGVTPGTAEFQRAAASARQQKGEQPATSQSENSSSSQNMSKQEYQPAQQQGRSDPFNANQQEHEAVNSLYMLAQPNNRTGANANQFAVPNQQQQISQNLANMNLQQRMQAQQDQSPTAGRNNSSIDMGRGEDDDGEDEKPATRSKGKKGSNSKASGTAANGRRKAEETPTKGPAKKRSRGNNGSINSIEDEDSDDISLKDEDLNMQQGSNGKKMTDEEKRKNFLERNRVAALKCRQRKKQWLANLQTKVEIFTQENDALTQQCGQLREEIINLKTLLLAHKDCPVSHQQGLGGQNMAQFMGNIDPNGQAHFGMMSQGNMPIAHMQGQGQGIQQGIQPGQGVQRS